MDSYRITQETHFFMPRVPGAREISVSPEAPESGILNAGYNAQSK
jgi:hypothetical protein